MKVLGSMTLAGLFIMNNANAMTPAWAQKGVTTEKCAGVSKTGKNDCAANGHGCAGMAKKDNDPNEWVYVPQGLCSKLGGKVAAATATAKPATIKKTMAAPAAKAKTPATTKGVAPKK